MFGRGLSGFIFGLVCLIGMSAAHTQTAPIYTSKPACSSDMIPVYESGKIVCLAPCAPGQQFNRLRSGAVACGPVCPPGMGQVEEGGACVCLIEGYVQDPTTGACGCPAGLVELPKSGPADSPRCALPCQTQSQQYNQLRDGRMVCGPKCGDGATINATGDACVCLVEGFVPDPATGACGCPAGLVELPKSGSADSRPHCALPCQTEGQQYNQLRDGRMVCGPKCGDGATVNATGNACVCLVEGFVPDPATGACGCPPNKVDVSSLQKGNTPGKACAPACPNGEEYQQGIDGALACVPPSFSCPPGTGMRGGNCVNPCPAGQEFGPQGQCVQTAGGCPQGTTLINGACTSPCANNAPLGPDGKCPLAPQTPKRKLTGKRSYQSLPRCPDGSVVPANGNCGVVGPQQPMILPLPFLFQAPQRGQAKQQAPTCSNGQPPMKNGQCPSAAMGNRFSNKSNLIPFIFQQPANNGLH